MANDSPQTTSWMAGWWPAGKAEEKGETKEEELDDKPKAVVEERDSKGHVGQEIESDSESAVSAAQTVTQEPEPVGERSQSSAAPETAKTTSESHSHGSEAIAAAAVAGSALSRSESSSTKPAKSDRSFADRLFTRSRNTAQPVDAQPAEASMASDRDQKKAVRADEAADRSADRELDSMLPKKWRASQGAAAGGLFATLLRRKSSSGNVNKDATVAAEVSSPVAAEQAMVTKEPTEASEPTVPKKSVVEESRIRSSSSERATSVDQNESDRRRRRRTRDLGPRGPSRMSTVISNAYASSKGAMANSLQATMTMTDRLTGVESQSYPPPARRVTFNDDADDTVERVGSAGSMERASSSKATEKSVFAKPPVAKAPNTPPKRKLSSFM